MPSQAGQLPKPEDTIRIWIMSCLTLMTVSHKRLSNFQCTRAPIQLVTRSVIRMKAKKRECLPVSGHQSAQLGRIFPQRTSDRRLFSQSGSLSLEPDFGRYRDPELFLSFFASFFFFFIFLLLLELSSLEEESSLRPSSLFTVFGPPCT